MAKTKKAKAVDRWVRRNQNKHLCHCGCGEFIIINKSHAKPGVSIPKFIRGHNLQPIDENYVPPEKVSHWDTLTEEEKKIRLASLKTFEKGENNPAWKGGRTANEHGYILVLCQGHPYSNKDGYVLEHRLVVEERTKAEDINNPLLIEIDGNKYLSPNAVVHHIDEVKFNNDPDNLMLLENGSAHGFIHQSSLPMNERLIRISKGIYTSKFIENLDQLETKYPWILNYIK